MTLYERGLLVKLARSRYAEIKPFYGKTWDDSFYDSVIGNRRFIVFTFTLDDGSKTTKSIVLERAV